MIEAVPVKLVDGPENVSYFEKRYPEWNSLVEETRLLSREWEQFSSDHRLWLEEAGFESGVSQNRFLRDVSHMLTQEAAVAHGKPLILAYVHRLFKAENMDEGKREALLDEVDAMAREGQARLLLSEVVLQTSFETDPSEKFEAVAEFLFSEAAKGKLESYVTFRDWAKLSLISSDEGSMRLLYSKLTGETAPISDWLQEQLETAEGVEIQFIKEQGVAAVSASMNQVYGEDTAAAAYFRRVFGTSDTPVVWYVPLSAVEMNQLQGYSEQQQRQVLARLVVGAREIVSMGHGFGASKDVWNSRAGELIGFNGEGLQLGVERRVGFAASVRGAEGTALVVEENGKKRPFCGDMNQTAVQWAETLTALGMVGENKKIFHIGHSMGGFEAVALASLMERRQAFGVYVLNPVLNNTPEHLKFLNKGWNGRLTGWYLQRVCGEKFGHAGLEWLSKVTGFRVQEIMISQVAEADEWVHGVHREQTKIKESMKAHRYGIVHTGEIWPYVDLATDLYPGRMVGWGVSLQDNTLQFRDDFERMKDRLDGQYAEFPEAGHYAQLADEGVGDVGKKRDRFFA